MDEILKNEMIREKGPIDIAEFMGLALGHPAHGYYMKGDPFGARGDFTTAPEISRCSARWSRRGSWMCGSRWARLSSR
jgi:SAM-dependent MidA family methyltransferase